MRKTLTCLVLSTTILLGGTGIAHADEPEAPSASESVEAIVEAVPEIASQTTDAAMSQDADSAVVVTTEGSLVDIPKDPADPVVLDTPEAAPLSIAIEGNADAEKAVRTADGTVVYAGTDEQASTAVQPTANGGVRFLTVIDGPEAPTEFRFTLDTPGAGYGITEDGRLATIAADGSPIAQLEAPWATDADNNAVPVSYRIDGATLVMEVHHAGASYPVVADPWWNPFSWGGGDPSSCNSNRSLCNRYNGLRGNIAGAVYFGFTANETSTLRSLVGAGALSARNLNWSTDSCSAVGKFSNGIMLGSFGNACGKHDFGYRNARTIFGRRHEDDRKVIDNQFRRDMQDTCTQFGIVATARTGICYGDAEATYRGVRQFGEKFYAA